MDTKKEILSRLGASIRSYRESAGYSQEDLANMCGYTTANARSTMSKIESGASDLPVSKLLLIANALGVSVTDLIPADHVAANKFRPTPSEELDVIDAYRALSDEGKTMICKMLEVKRNTGQDGQSMTNAG